MTKLSRKESEEYLKEMKTGGQRKRKKKQLVSSNPLKRRRSTRSCPRLEDSINEEEEMVSMAIAESLRTFKTEKNAAERGVGEDTPMEGLGKFIDDFEDGMESEETSPVKAMPSVTPLKKGGGGESTSEAESMSDFCLALSTSDSENELPVEEEKEEEPEVVSKSHDSIHWERNDDSSIGIAEVGLEPVPLKCVLRPKLPPPTVKELMKTAADVYNIPSVRYCKPFYSKPADVQCRQ